MTAPHIAHAIWQTLRISVPTIWDGLRGSLTPETVDQRLAQWSGAIVGRAHIDLKVEGVEHAPRGESFVLMSNHQSLYDVPVIYQALHRRIRMVAKSELFQVPIWGRAMKNAGFIELHRQDRERSRHALSASSELLRAGTNIWIAPEGTRSRDGRLGAFRKGGFHLALESGARIVPLSIVGTREVLSAESARIREGCSVKVTLHAPVDPRDYGEDRKDELVAEVRRRIASALPLA